VGAHIKVARTAVVEEIPVYRDDYIANAIGRFPNLSVTFLLLYSVLSDVIWIYIALCLL
jgi:hypothetical protein